jgi:FPC/CPF motif-containing protein YcgG
MQDRAANPYLGGDVRRSYHGMRGKRLMRLQPEEGPADAAATMVHETFRSMALSETYPCVVARSAMRRGDYRFGCYPQLGTEAAAAAVACDLWEFVAEFPIRPDRYASFVAAFDGPCTATEQGFEDLLWRQLQLLHGLDVRHSRWDAEVGTDPTEYGFSFSFAERAFFIVGMHPGASRWARRTAWPTLVFNSHAQFDLLRDAGVMPRMQQTVRMRDRRVQGSENPSLRQFDAKRPETVMYSGRLVEDDWTCPFRPAEQATESSTQQAEEGLV